MLSILAPMQIKLTHLATNTSNGFILNINAKTYVINMFEGFQRFCTEYGIPLGNIDVVFSTRIENLNGILGWYLTMGDQGKRNCGFVGDYKFDIESIKRIGYRPSFTFLDTYDCIYEDEYIKPTLTTIDNITNYYIELPNVAGSLIAEKLPRGFPVNCIKKLKAKEKVVVDGVEYDGSDYCNQDIVLGGLLFLYSTKINSEIIDLCKKAKWVFCMNREVIHTLNRTEMVANIFNCTRNGNIEYIKQFRKLQEIGNIIQPITNTNGVEENILNNMDHFIYSKEVSDLKLIRNETKVVNERTNSFPKKYLLFLGTGCAVPAKTRATSSILLQNDGYSILLDCGEDTIGQIKRAYGNCNIIQTLRVIYLSHSHPDHMLGLVAVLMETKNEITVIGSQLVEKYLKNFNIANWKFIDIFTTTEYNHDDNLTFQFARSVHNIDSFFTTVEFNNFRFSYSGDCRPSKLFAELSRDCDLMIHERTFDDMQIDKAIKTNHSTESEAIDIFKQSNSRKLILTHFSQRNEVLYTEVTDHIQNAYDFYIYDDF
ncbi:RNZ [Enterospora canceri]|uniref:ribonuclease Z n=1 Tax=Enterospora canceri TaxID=1081671 RepID=A0A1Y1S9G4_9MICR|nr:RNZ [Enterospora canceri]